MTSKKPIEIIDLCDSDDSNSDSGGTFGSKFSKPPSSSFSDADVKAAIKASLNDVQFLETRGPTPKKRPVSAVISGDVKSVKKEKKVSDGGGRFW